MPEPGRAERDFIRLRHSLSEPGRIRYHLAKFPIGGNPLWPVWLLFFGRKMDRSSDFSDWVICYQDRAFAYAYAVLRDRAAAEDAIQAAFLTAWLRFGDLREPKAFGVWLRRIVRTECVRLLRRTRPATLPLDEAVGLASGDSPLERLRARELSRDVAEAVAGLPEHERIVLSLHYGSGLSYKELASFLELPLSTIKKRLFSARRRLWLRAEQAGPSLQEVQREIQSERPSRNDRLRRRVMQVTELLELVIAGKVETLARALDRQPELLDQRGPGRWWPGEASALNVASAGGLGTVVELLIERGADLSIEGSGGVSPVVYPAIEGHRDIAELLIAEGAELDIFAAAALGDAESVRAFLESEPELVHERTPDGRTPLHMCRSVEVAQVLLEAGADPEAREELHRMTPLQWIAATGRHRELRDYLIERGARAESSDIFWACTYGDLEAVRRFLEEEPDQVHCRRSEGLAVHPVWVGSTPLHEAAQRGETAIVKLLIEAGADVNGRRPNGSTPLHAAAACGHRDVALLLLEEGADPKAEDDEFAGTPSAWARFFRHEELSETLAASDS